MHQIVKTILEPVLYRIGSMIAGALVGLGLAAAHGPKIEQLVVALGLLAVELVATNKLRKKPGAA